MGNMSDFQIGQVVGACLAGDFVTTTVNPEQQFPRL
jgi:hypothetical protein